MDEMEVLKIIRQAKQSKRTILNLSNKNIKRLPAEIGELTNLKTLSLSRNQLSSLPDEIGYLENLRTLSLSRNQLKTLPAQIKKLKNLETLDVSFNLLASLPSELGQLAGLKRLYLGHNQFNHLPPSIYYLPNLEQLSVKDNHLKELSAEIYRLVNLIECDISNNEIEELVPEIGSLDKLATLLLDNNPVENLLQQIRTKDINALKRFIREQYQKAIYEVKMLIIGQGDVGKTSVKNRLLYNIFNENQEPTHGIEINSWSFDYLNEPEQKIRINVWDFGGQEINHRIHQLFFDANSIYLLVLDARQGGISGRLTYWLSLISSCVKKCQTLLVVNKYEKNVNYCEFSGLADSFPNKIKKRIDTSCKKPPHGIEELKRSIGILIDEIPEIKIHLSMKGLQIRNRLMNSSDVVISYSDFENLCREHNIESEAIGDLSRTLHNLGVIFHYQDDPRLADKIILKIDWFIKAVYTFLQSDKIRSNGGIFEYDDLPEICKDTNIQKQHHFTLLDLLTYFELIIEIPEKKYTWLVPELLSYKKKKYNWIAKDNINLECQYDFPPEGVLPQLIVRMNKFIIDEDSDLKCWREGVYLQKDKAKAFVRLILFKNKIEIKTRGDKAKELLKEICDQLDSINKKKVRKLVPCSCTKDCSYRFDFNFLEKVNKAFDVGTSVICQENIKAVNAKELLDGIRPSDFHEEYKWTVFISYSSKDKKIINKIENDLTVRGISNWVDKDKIIAVDDDIIGSIQDGLDNSKYLLACFSEHQLKSKWCREEYNSILNSEFSNETNQKVIPMIIDDIKKEALPRLLRNKPIVRYLNEKEYLKLLEELKNAEQENYK